MTSLNFEATYGALLVGVFVSIFLQGVGSLQAFVYYETFPEDSWRLKALVAYVWTLDLAHLLLICQAVYHYLVRSWGNDAALLETTVPLDTHMIVLPLTIMGCQAFFVHRIWKFSQNAVLTGSLAVGCHLRHIRFDAVNGL
ncbi:hypothetical protein R3P38DRAFT_239154 [Favolaschia claudopus]|uniref:Uncharacterized protein n=1 Tax=Favolaschia claudopus TaxID=2862362 RepID=A0AAW0CWV7_9AGAR